MYNEKILNQLDNLKYLGALKGSTVSIVSKPNEFGDAVKFYAQINKDDIIQKISYRASGCTHFLVFCNYFCSLVEGKTIKSALNIKAEKLENFVELDESKTHIVPIILNAFALLIKRYRKGVESGKIEPCAVEEKVETTPKSRPMTSKAFTKVVGEIMKNIELSKNNNNQIAVSKNNEKPSTEDNKIKKDNVDVKTIAEVEVKVEDKATAPKKVKKIKVEETKPIETQELDKDIPLENLVDEGIILDNLVVKSVNDTVVDNKDNQLQDSATKSTEKVKTTKTRKSTKKSTVEPSTDNQTIEELNKEITGLIDTIENDIAATETKAQEQPSSATEVVKEKKATKKTLKENSTKKLTTKEEKINSTTETIEQKEEKDTANKQTNNLLALKSMLSNRAATKPVEEKKVEEKKPENKINNLASMINKMHNTDANNVNKKVEKQPTKKETTKKEVVKKEDKKLNSNKTVANDTSANVDKLSSLKASLANIRTNTNNTESTAKKSSKEEKQKITTREKTVDKKSTKKEVVKKEKTPKAKKETTDKKTIAKDKKVEKQPKEVKQKKVKKNSYDMEYEPIDDGSKKGFFSWLRRK